MTDLRKAARYAKEVLDYVDRFLNMNEAIRYELVRDAIADLDKALAQPDKPLRLSPVYEYGHIHEASQLEQESGKCGCGANLYIDEDGKPCSKAQTEQFVVSFPSFMRKRIEQALKDAIHPTGMSVHDGKVKVLVSDLHRMLLVIDSVLAQPKQTMTPISPDQYERVCFTCGACVGKPWVGLTAQEMNHVFAANVGYPETGCCNR